MGTLLRSPAVKLISYCRIDETRCQSPETHLRLLDTVIATSEVDDNLITHYTSEVANNTAHQSRQIRKASLTISEVIRRASENLGDGLVGNDARGAAKGEDDTSLDDMLASVAGICMWVEG